VEPVYSGALLSRTDGDPIIEGVAGAGDKFMKGEAGPARLPDVVRSAVLTLYRLAANQLGPVRLEWVYDGRVAWVVQLHKGASSISERMIYPGQPAFFHRFEVSRGLEALRALIAQVQGTGEGLTLVGDVGITSHFGDVLRRARIPSRIEPG